VFEHPASSPDLAPSDFFLFPKIKEMLKGRHFDDIDDIRSNTTAALKAIPQNQFQNCFEGWTWRWHRCIASQGEYFEGNHGGIQQWGMWHFYHDEFANFIVRPCILHKCNGHDDDDDDDDDVCKRDNVVCQLELHGAGCCSASTPRAEFWCAENMLGWL